jgi:hypothetical protein
VENNLFRISRGPGYKDLYVNAIGNNHDPPRSNSC